jgi:Domain of unknown function (DUF4129)
MYAHPINIKKAGLLRGALVLLPMLAMLHGAAQSGGKLPDSVNTSEEVLPPKADSTAFTAPDTSGRDAGKQDTVLSQPDSVVLRSIPDSVIGSAKKEKDFEYANDPAYWKRDTIDEPQPPRFRTPVKGWNVFTQILLILVIAGALLLVLYRFFYRAPLMTSGEEGYGDEKAELSEDDLDKHIQQALQAKDHRLATRYLFLKTLRLLDARQLIRYQAKTTNYEYVMQMGAHETGGRFRFLADAYERVWYGDFSLSEGQFGRLLHYFEDFYKTINSGMK